MRSTITKSGFVFRVLRDASVFVVACQVFVALCITTWVVCATPIMVIFAAIFIVTTYPLIFERGGINFTLETLRIRNRLIKKYFWWYGRVIWTINR